MCRRLIFLSSLVLVLGLVGYASGGNTASNPSPADGAQCVDPNTVLTWSRGDRAASHDVYFDIYNPPTVFRGNQPGTTYDPPRHPWVLYDLLLAN
jgi:hypothetical protein